MHMYANVISSGSRFINIFNNCYRTEDVWTHLMIIVQTKGLERTSVTAVDHRLKVTTSSAVN